MKLKRFLGLMIVSVFLLFGVFSGYSLKAFQPNAGYQVSTLGALNIGVYEGALTLTELKQHGDFGLGTFEGLDGEMVVLNGKIYQIKTDGVAYPVTDGLKTPFSTVTFFRKDRSLRLAGEMNYQELRQKIDEQLTTPNLPLAIRIQGSFPYIKARSVPKQQPPYPPLDDVVSQQQQVFELRNVRGTLVGFRLPQYFENVNAAGYHFHFITSDRKAGGHVLDGDFLNPMADVETLRSWQMLLPNRTAFEQAPL